MLETGDIKPRDYQWDAYSAIGEHIRTSRDPAFIEASVGAGKTIMIGMLAKRCQDVGMSCLVLARQGELIEQATNTLWKMGVKNSTFSASLGKKSSTFNTICGTEGTVSRAISLELSSKVFDVLAIDEAHMVDWQDAISDDPKTQYGVIINELLKRNPKLRVVGFTGSPFRGTDPILGEFWRKKLIDVGTSYLVDRGYLVPTTFGFGHDDVKYDLSEFHAKGGEGAHDFTSKELQAMQRKILKEGTTTQKIMLEIEKVMSGRLVALITCAGKKHCEEAAKYLPEGTYGIVTDSISTKQRKQILDDARALKIKYVFQVGCLTTGVDVSTFDVIVMLRNIGSLTLLIQLIGRGLRPHFSTRNEWDDFFSTDPDHNEQRKQMLSISSKPDCLVLDYSGTMHELGELYHNPILESAELDRAKKAGENLLDCPQCGTANSQHARRCIGKSNTSSDGRCEFFWQSKQCEKCGTHNDTAARNCRKCDAQLVDPNAKLTGKHYTDDDLINVNSMEISATRCGNGVLVNYFLENGEKATEVFWPFGDNVIAKKLWRAKFIFRHVNGKEWQQRAMRLQSVGSVIKSKAMFDVPKMITHRINDKGKSIINRKVFLSGRSIDNEEQIQ